MSVAPHAPHAPHAPRHLAEELRAYRRLDLDVVRAEGVELVLASGARVLDLYGGHCVNSLGAGDPGLGRALAAQWQRLSFTTNLLEHAARGEFLAAFGALLPALGGGDTWQVFCSNSGAEANENALKLALAASGRSQVVCFEGGFHGRSAAAAAVSDKPAAFPHAPFDVVRLPWSDSAAAQAAIDARTAAVILEPIQSLAGVREPAPGFLAGLRQACDEAGALLIFDEVQTASGRLGVPFAAQHFGVLPDALTTAKGAAGGLPIGLTVVRASLAQRCPEGLLGSTFGGAPLVLAAAAEVARRVAAPGFLEQVRASAEALRAAARVGPVRALRGAGLLLGLELEAGHSARSLRERLLAGGVLTGLCDDPQVLRLCPPLTLEPEHAARFGAALRAACALEPSG